MILYVLIFRNTRIGAFTQPQFSDVEPEKAAIQLARALKMSDDEAVLKKYSDLEMYDIGTFNDETGVFDAKQPVKLLDCAKCIEKKVEEDVGNEEKVDPSISANC